jgi:hypothetical protein
MDDGLWAQQMMKRNVKALERVADALEKLAGRHGDRAMGTAPGEKAVKRSRTPGMTKDVTSVARFYGGDISTAQAELTRILGAHRALGNPTISSFEITRQFRRALGLDEGVVMNLRALLTDDYMKTARITRLNLRDYKIMYGKDAS